MTWWTPGATGKCKMTHFSMWKSVCFRVVYASPNRGKCKTVHFCRWKSVSFCTFAARRGTQESHEPLCFACSYCNSVISRKVESRSSRVSVSAFRVPVGTRKLKHARIDFPLSEKSRNCNMSKQNIWFRVIPESCGTPQKCKTTHFSICENVCSRGGLYF